MVTESSKESHSFGSSMGVLLREDACGMEKIVWLEQVFNYVRNFQENYFDYFEV